ncbi:MAG TPA: hypothetical protein VL137_01695 [Polyangiaceae bacterium]|nr:hypothetical protein [Polyangiaceae bacterium]
MRMRFLKTTGQLLALATWFVGCDANLVLGRDPASGQASAGGPGGSMTTNVGGIGSAGPQATAGQGGDVSNGAPTGSPSGGAAGSGGTGGTDLDGDGDDASVNHGPPKASPDADLDPGSDEDDGGMN